VTLKPELGSLKVIDTYRSAACDFLLTFYSNHWPISYRFRDKRWFLSKIAKYCHPGVFCAPADGVPLGVGIGAWNRKTRIMGLPGRERSLTIFSAAWIQYTNVTDRRTTAKTALTH